MRGFLKRADIFVVDDAAKFVKRKNRIYVRAAVLKFIDFLEHENIIDEAAATVCKEKHIPKVSEVPPKSREIPGSGDILAVINGLEKDDRMIARFMFYTGCRVHEAVGVKVRDLDFKNGNVTIYGKGRIRKKPRACKIPMDFSAELERYSRTLGLLDPEFIFWPNSGASVDSRATMFRDRFRDLSVRIVGKPIGTHDIRRFYATHLYKQTRDIQLVQKTMGHARIDTTQKYTQFATQDEQLSQARDIMSNLEASEGSVPVRNRVNK